MNVIKVNVNFKNGTNFKQGIDLIEGDYNSTKMVFNFDTEQGTKVLEMKSPSDEIVLHTEIQNNEVILVGEADVTTKANEITYIKYTDANQTVYWYNSESEKLYDSEFIEVQNVDIEELTKVTTEASIFNEVGDYVYEIILYDGDSKLTSAKDKLKIKKKQINSDGETAVIYKPVFDQMMGELESKINEVDNLDIDISKIGSVAAVTIVKKDGTQESVNINDGPANILTIGAVTKGETAGATITGNTPNQTLNLVLPKGDKGDKGDTGATGQTGNPGPANTISIGTVTKGEEASATITGEAPNQILSFVLPKGDKGDKGDTGNTGATGSDGQDGFSPSATVTKLGTTATISITDKNGTTTASVSDGEEYDDTELRGLIAEKQDAIIAGSNITISSDGKTINATNTTYSNATTSTDGLMSSTDKNKLNGIASGAEVNVQANWNESNSSSDAYIQNKPTIPPEVTEATVTNWGFTKNTGNYSKPSGGIPATDLSSTVQTSLGKANTAIQSHQDISGKQDVTDNTLTTSNKTIPTAINEVNSIAKGANQALSYSNYSAMVTAFNSLTGTEYNVGQNVMIVTVEVPDLWISSIESTSSTYTYTTDAAIVSALQTNGYIQVGYYKLSMLETQKVDLTNYVTKTTYASGSDSGVIKTLSVFATGTGTTQAVAGGIYAAQKTYAEYQSMSDLAFVGKGTLNNVLGAKNYEEAANKTTTISSSSTNTQYPSAKAVYDYIVSLDASGVSY